MRFWLLPLALLLIAPTAAAQAGVFATALRIEEVDIREGVDGSVRQFDLVIVLDCQVSMPEPTVTYTLHVSALVNDRLASLTGPDAREYVDICNNGIPGLPSQFVDVLRYTTTLGGLNESRTLEYNMEVGIRSNGPPMFFTESRAAATFDITFNATMPEATSYELVDEPPAEETVPGPALPLLAIVLLALARRS